MITAVKEMAKQGFTLIEIAKALGIPFTIVRSIV